MNLRRDTTTSTWRIVGFAVPAIAYVVVRHLAELFTFGELLDGVFSGLWFVLVFALGTILRRGVQNAERANAGEPRRPNPTLQLMLGVLAAVGVWCALALLYTWVNAAFIAEAAFIVNSGAVFVIALALPSPSTRSAPPGALSGRL